MSSHHPINESKTGREIALSLLTDEFGASKAKELLSCLTGYTYPIEIIQKGQLTRLLDATDKLIAENAELEKVVQSLRKQISGEDIGDLAERVLNFCKESQKRGEYPLNIANNLAYQFPSSDELELVCPEQIGSSVQVKLPNGSYIRFDESTEMWSINTRSL